MKTFGRHGAFLFPAENFAKQLRNERCHAPGTPPLPWGEGVKAIGVSMSRLTDWASPLTLFPLPLEASAKHRQRPQTSSRTAKGRAGTQRSPQSPTREERDRPRLKAGATSENWMDLPSNGLSQNSPLGEGTGSDLCVMLRRHLPWERGRSVVWRVHFLHSAGRPLQRGPR